MREYDVENVLRLMGNDLKRNYADIKGMFEKQGIKMKDYLFVLTDEWYNEKMCLLAIKSVLSVGKVDPNLKAEFGYNFIQNAMYAGHSAEFIVELINYCLLLEKKLNVNHQDRDGDTMLHTAIYADDFKGNVYRVYEALIKGGFNSKLVDIYGRNIVDAMLFERETNNKFSINQINDVEKLYMKETAAKQVKQAPSTNNRIDNILEKMGYDLKNNFNILRNELPKSEAGYLHYLTDDLHNELCCFTAVKSLLEAGCDPNVLATADYNFIQNAMYAGYGTAFINGCIDASMDSSLKQKLNVNHKDDDGDTILHTAIYCNDECALDIASIYSTLLKYGFDSKIRDKSGRTVVEAMKYEQRRCKKFTDEQIKCVEQMYEKSLGIKADSFSKEEREKNKKLDENVISGFLKKFRR